MWAGMPLYGRTALAGGPYVPKLHTLGKAHAALSGASLFSCQYEFFDELVSTAVLFVNTLIRDLFLIYVALYYI